MRSIGAILIAFALASCDGRKSFDEEAALAWSKTSGVQRRDKVTLYSFQRADGSWVAISIAKMKETDQGLLHDGGEILTSGFLTYPGGQHVQSITEAIKVCSESKGSPTAHDSK